MRYRKKPVVMDAEQWFPSKSIPGVYFHSDDDTASMSSGYIDTPEGTMRVNAGDWVITGVAGEKYLCKPDIFAKTYELVIEMRVIR